MQEPEIRMDRCLSGLGIDLNAAIPPGESVVECHKVGVGTAKAGVRFPVVGDTVLPCPESVDSGVDEEWSLEEWMEPESERH